MNINIDELHYGIIIVGGGGCILEVNKAAVGIMECSKNDFLDKGFDLFEGHVALTLSKIINDKTEPLPHEEVFEVVLKSGSRKYIKVIVTKMEEGNLLVTLYDYTSSISNSSDIYFKNRMEAYRNITELISLEYNNHLTAILGFASFAKTNLNPESDMYKYFNIIENGAINASSLTNQLLTYTGIDYFRQKNINLNKVILQNIDIFRKVFPANIRLDISLYPGDLLLYWDENQINQVIINTIMNAKEAIEEKKSTGRILVTTGTEEKNIFMTVEDDGVGISSEYLDRIFNRNFTTKDLRYHSGLGLSVIEGIVKNLGGSVKVTSRKGSGTKLRISIPDKIIDVKSFEVEKKVEAVSGHNESVLIIDDKQSIRSLTSILLKGKNYNPLTAGDAEEGLKILQTEKVDLVLLDIMMPGIRGDELYHKIVELKPGMPIVILTGTSNEKLVYDLVIKQGAGLILKPFKNAEFYEIIEKYLRKK